MTNFHHQKSIRASVPQITLAPSLAKMFLGFALIIASIMFASPARAQVVNSTWLGDGSQNFSNGNWSNSAWWNPHTVPNNSGPTTYDVTLPWDPNGGFFNGPHLDIGVAIHNLTMINRLFLDNQGSGVTNLTVTGSTGFVTTPGRDGEFGAIFCAGGSTYSLGTLTNYTVATHTLEAGDLGALSGGTIAFHNADIITNRGVLFVAGIGSRILNQDNSTSAYANLRTNEGVVQFADGAGFGTVSDLTNNGAIFLGANDGTNTTFTINGLLTNYDPSAHTLTGGQYEVDTGTSTTGVATLRFPNADIRTIVNAIVKVDGANASIRDFLGANAFRNLQGIQGGTFTSGGTSTITPTGGTFTNMNAGHVMPPNSNITVQGNYSASGGGTISIGAPGNASNTSLTISGNALIDGGGLDMGGQPGVNTQYHTTLQVMNGLQFRGAYLTGTGTTFADVGMIQGSVLNPGHSPGQLAFQGNLTLDGTTTTDMQIGGLSAGDQFDQVVQSGGGLTLGGKLLLSFVDGFEYDISPDDTFDIITSGSNLAGSFSNIVSGSRIATNDGKGTFIVAYSGTNKVTLSQFLPPPKILSVTRMPNQNFKIFCQGYPEAGVYRLEASNDLNPTNFQSIETIGTSSGSFLEFEDLDSNNHPARFYRIIFPGDDSPPARATSHASKRKG